MIIDDCPVLANEQVAPDTFVLTFLSQQISSSVQPGQFVNVRSWTGSDPLLRRPFSVYRTDGDRVSIVFNVVGRGTALLAELRPDTTVDVLGPLGSPFTYNTDDYSTGVLIAGGLGVAPLPMLTSALAKLKKPFITLLGARTSRHLLQQHLQHLSTATDDGSEGFHGTVVELARKLLSESPLRSPKFFGCGPTPMLRALSDLASALSVPCEISLEGPMGCGFGICQGCPVPLRQGEKYALMCKEGPVFDSRRITIR